MENLMAHAPVNTMVVSAVLVLLKLLLGIQVSIYRMRTDIMWGDAGDATMQRRIRAHANHSEWVPAAIIILALIEMVGVNALLVTVLGIVLIIGRGLHALGLMGNAEVFNRAAGMVLTWAVMAIAAVIAVIEYFAPGTF